MKTFLFFLLILCGITFLNKEVSAQCDCFDSYFVSDISPSGRISYRTALDELKNSPLVFIGKVKSVKRVTKKAEGESYSINEVVFDVSKVWKKNVDKTIVINTHLPCYTDFKKKEEYLVYTSYVYNVPVVSFCSRTKKLSEAESDLAAFARDATYLERRVLPD